MDDLRIRSISRGAEIKILINGRPHLAFEGESVHSALLAAGYRVLRKTKKMDQPRGIFCGMGVCYDCLVTINGEPNQRACMTMVDNGMEIQVDE
jgi:sarcosine oxidase subunit alpha